MAGKRDRFNGATQMEFNLPALAENKRLQAENRQLRVENNMLLSEVDQLRRLLQDNTSVAVRLLREWIREEIEIAKY